MNSRWIALAAAAAVAALAALAATGDDADAQARLNFDDFPLVEKGLIVSRIGHRIDTTLPAASGGRGQIQYSLSPLLPTGLEFNSDTRQLSGTPQGDPGQYFLDYNAVDSTNSTAKVIITIWLNIEVDERNPNVLGRTTTDLGTLNRNISRWGRWHTDSATRRFPCNPEYQSMKCHEGPELSRWEGISFTLNRITEITISLTTSDSNTPAVMEINPVRIDQNIESIDLTDWHHIVRSGSRTSEITLNMRPGRFWIAVGGEFNPALFRGLSPTSGSLYLGSYVLHLSSPDFNLAPTSGYIIARRHNDDGRIEVRWMLENTEEVLPQLRFLPANAPSGQWLSSSDIIVNGINLGRINIKINRGDRKIEYAFTTASGRRILVPNRYFPADAIEEYYGSLWLTSSLIEWGGTTAEQTQYIKPSSSR